MLKSRKHDIKLQHSKVIKIELLSKFKIQVYFAEMNLYNVSVYALCPNFNVIFYLFYILVLQTLYFLMNHLYPKPILLRACLFIKAFKCVVRYTLPLTCLEIHPRTIFYWSKELFNMGGGVSRSNTTNIAKYKRLYWIRFNTEACKHNWPSLIWLNVNTEINEA